MKLSKMSILSKIKESFMVQNYVKIYPYVRPYLSRTILAIALMLPLGAMDAVIAWVLKPYMDVVMIEKSAKVVSLLPLLIIVFSFIQSLLNYFATYLNTWVGNKITMDLKRSLYKKLMRREASFFDKTTSGDVMQTIKELNLKRSYSTVKKTTSLSIYEDLIKELYLKGLSGKEIAQQVHAHPFSVYKKIRRMGLERSQKWAEYNSKFKGKKQLLFAMYSKGKSVSELAAFFGAHENTVRYHLKKWKAKNV